MVTDKVVTLWNDTCVNERGVNDECIECLEKLLKKAQDGEITGVAVAAQYADHSTGDVVGGFVWNNALIGCLMAMVHKLVTGG